MARENQGFYQKVWELTSRIPKGRVTTYRIIAEKLGTRAYRAVGSALNRNRSSHVPCHRVVKSDSRIGGFARGTETKEKMLRKEGILIKDNRITNFQEVVFRFE